MCVFFYVLLLPKHLMNLWMNFKINSQNVLSNVNLGLINIYSQSISRWPPDLIGISQHRNGCNSVSLTENHIHTWPYFHGLIKTATAWLFCKTLAWKAAGIPFMNGKPLIKCFHIHSIFIQKCNTNIYLFPLPKT